MISCFLRRSFGACIGHVSKDLSNSTKISTHRHSSVSFTTHFRITSNMSEKTVTLDNINPNIKNMDFALLGPMAIRTKEIENELSKGSKKPFTEVIKTHIGDCHAMGQKPLTFLRQVLTLCTYPVLMKDERFPDDVKERARDILKFCGGGSVGSYSDSAGIEIIKKHVAQYIERRDGIPTNYLDIMLSTGATQGIQNVLSLFKCSDKTKPSGVMIPIPQYPVYSATIAEYGMYPIYYYLDEDNAWALNIKELKHAIAESRNVCQPRVLVVINPGNPTGSVLTKENIEEIIRFAYEERLFLMADEVYQDNIYVDGMKFHSFKKILMELGEPYKNMELASFMSASKGYMGECGLRGGYCELINVDPEVKKMFLKCTSARLCSNVLGQVAMDCVVNPPRENEPSYDLFMKEKNAVLQSFKEKANLVARTFSNMKGMKCNEVAGAMYAFPRLILPQKAIEKARRMGQTPDFFYAMQLLENTGICVIPGSAFGQVPGTYHFRTTILPQIDKLKVMLKLLKEHHENFLAEYD